MKTQYSSIKLNTTLYLLFMAILFYALVGCSKSEEKQKDSKDLFKSTVSPIEVSEPVRLSLKELLDVALASGLNVEYRDSLLAGFKLSPELKKFWKGDTMTAIWDYDKLIVTQAYAVERDYKKVILFATPLFLEHKSKQAVLHSMLGTMYYKLAILDMVNRNLYKQTPIGYLVFKPDERTLKIMRAAKIEINEGARVDSSTFEEKIKKQINTHLSGTYTEFSVKLDQGVAAHWLISLIPKRPELRKFLGAVVQAFRWDEAFYKLPPPLDPLAAATREKYFNKIDSLQSDFGFQIKGVCALASLLSTWTDAMTFYMLLLELGGKERDISWLRETLRQDGELIKEYSDLLAITLPSDVRKILTLRQLDRQRFLKLFQVIENQIDAKFPKPHKQLFLLIFWENSAIMHLNTMPERTGYSAFESARHPLEALIEISEKINIGSTITKSLSIILSRTYYPLLTVQHGHEMAIELVQICDMIFSALLLEAKNQAYVFKSRERSSSRASEPYAVNFKEARPPEVHPSEYFPIKLGTKWVYQIEVGDIDPLTYRLTSWPLVDEVKEISARGSISLKKDKKTYALIIRIQSKAERQGPLKYPLGLKLEIEEDELGIFDHHQEVFWAISDAYEIMVTEVITFPPYIPGAPTGNRFVGIGYSSRIIFGVVKPGYHLGLGLGGIDLLQYVGVDKQVPKYENISCLHFRRIIKADENLKKLKHGHIGESFTEDMWFAKGKGLVRLEQKVGEKTSMTWTLVEFTEEISH